MQDGEPIGVEASLADCVPFENDRTHLSTVPSDSPVGLMTRTSSAPTLVPGSLSLYLYLLPTTSKNPALETDPPASTYCCYPDTLIIIQAMPVSMAMKALSRPMVSLLGDG